MNLRSQIIPKLKQLAQRAQPLKDAFFPKSVKKPITTAVHKMPEPKFSPLVGTQPQQQFDVGYTSPAFKIFNPLFVDQKDLSELQSLRKSKHAVYHYQANGARTPEEIMEYQTELPEKDKYDALRRKICEDYKRNLEGKDLPKNYQLSKNDISEMLQTVTAEKKLHEKNIREQFENPNKYEEESIHLSAQKEYLQRELHPNGHRLVLPADTYDAERIVKKLKKENRDVIVMHTRKDDNHPAVKAIDPEHRFRMLENDDYGDDEKAKWLHKHFIEKSFPGVRFFEPSLDDPVILDNKEEVIPNLSSKVQ